MLEFKKKSKLTSEEREFFRLQEEIKAYKLKHEQWNDYYERNIASGKFMLQRKRMKTVSPTKTQPFHFALESRMKMRYPLNSLEHSPEKFY